MSSYQLPFEEEVREIERELNALRGAEGKGGDSREIASLERRLERALKSLYERLTPWQRVQVARHPERPSTADYTRLILSEFHEFHGDRRFGDDRAVLCGFGRINDVRIALVGHQKGRTTPERIRCNFGMPHPEGYRKALRVMRLAERLGLPIVTLIDTPGAYCGVAAEERGQAYAIAENIMEMSQLRTPIVGAVIAEGGSGGALGIGMVDTLLVLQYAYYSVISPEGCAAILWRSGDQVEEAAAALRLSAEDLQELGLADGIVPEPVGGAHRDPECAAANLKAALLDALERLSHLSADALLERRRRKYRLMGVFMEGDRLVDQARERLQAAQE